MRGAPQPTRAKAHGLRQLLGIGRPPPTLEKKIVLLASLRADFRFKKNNRSLPPFPADTACGEPGKQGVGRRMWAAFP